MDSMRAGLETVAGRPVLRFRRHLVHPPERVWRAITDPDELVRWFPARVTAELRAGAEIRFAFEDVDDTPTTGRILEFDPPKVFAFSWGEDVLRWEVLPRDAGCLLLFSHTLGGDPGIARLAAGRNAAGWDACLGALLALLDRRSFDQPSERLAPIESYVEEFGLGTGEVHDRSDGFLVRFARDLVWKPVDEVWTLLTEEDTPEVGGEPPIRVTNDYVQAGPVTAAEPPYVLEYEWRHDGAPAGRVRWEVTRDDLGTRVVLTQTVPARLGDLLATVLAAWHVHLECFFAATQGEIRCPWPTERTEELRKRYAAVR